MTKGPEVANVVKVSIIEVNSKVSAYTSSSRDLRLVAHLLGGRLVSALLELRR